MKSNVITLVVFIASLFMIVGCDTQEQLENDSHTHDCEAPIVLDETLSQQEAESLFHQELLDLFSPKYTQLQLDSAVTYLVEEQGFDPEKIDAQDWGITYDGDMGLPVDDILEDMRSEGEVEMRTYRKQWSLVTNTSDINIATIAYGTYALPYSWYSATNVGSSNWNNLNGSLDFSRYHYANYYSWLPNTVWIIPLDFSLFPQLSNFALGYTTLLSGGNAAKFIFLNKDHAMYTNSSQVRMNHSMMHEIGHAIGFYHTDTNDGTPIPGMPWNCSGSNHVHSVMRQYQGNSTFYNFTYCDKQAYYTLY